MDYLISIFLLGVMVTFIVIVGLARAAEFAKAESAGRMEIDPIPKDWDLVPSASTAVSAQRPDARASDSTLAT